MKTGEEADVAVDVRWFQFDELFKAGLSTDTTATYQQPAGHGHPTW